jgi:hypothetical protein
MSNLFVQFLIKHDRKAFMALPLLLTNSGKFIEQLKANKN